MSDFVKLFQLKKGVMIITRASGMEKWWLWSLLFREITQRAKGGTKTWLTAPGEVACLCYPSV